MIKILKSNQFENVIGTGFCNGKYLMPPKQTCTEPVSPGAMLRLNTTDGTVKVTCSAGASPWGVFVAGDHVSCFPDSAMDIACLDELNKNWCAGVIDIQRVTRS